MSTAQQGQLRTSKHLSCTYAIPAEDVESSRALERRKAALLDAWLEAVHAVHVLNIESCENATAA